MSAPAAQPAVPYLPLTRPTIDEATIAGVVDVLRSGWITSGPNVKALEGKLSEYFGGRPVRLLSSGTAALELALRLSGIGPGDEVIVPPYTFLSTASAVIEANAIPVFADIDLNTFNFEPKAVEAAITPQTTAIMPVSS